MSETNDSKAAVVSRADGDVESVIMQAIRSIRYGSIEVVIHNAHVVQVERREKLRFSAQP